MACCVVLNHRAQDIGGEDSSDNGSCATASTSAARPSQRPNPETRLCCGASRGPASRGDQGASNAADFTEPWTKLLALAREKTRRSHSKAKGPPIRIGTAKNVTRKAAREREAAEEPRDVDADSAQPESKSGSNETRARPSTSKAPCVETPAAQKRVSRSASQPLAKTRRKRASSLEWDCSGTEGADTPPVPQNKKRKAAKRRKRDTSLEIDWTPNEPGSACSDSEAGPDDFESSHQCRICNLKFKRPWRLRVHLQQHLQPEIRPFKCDEDGCSKGYYYKFHLERHKSRSHSDLVIVTKSICPSEGCNRIFESQSGLKRHINKIHSEENLKFSCPHCEKKFSKTRQLRFHIAEHTGEPPLRCEKCNAGVFSDKELKRHIRTHKEYPCDVSGCDKILSSFPAFQKHKAEHNKCFQSLECAHCNKVFKKKSDLRGHVMTHLDERTIFQCPYDSCPRFYYQERNLNSHIRVYHEKSSNFACTWEGCEMQFLSRKALAKHLNVHENGRAEMKRKEGPKAPRKDKGLPRRSMATQLAGVEVIPNVEKTLLAPDRNVEINQEEKPDCSGGGRKKRSSKPKNSRPKEDVPAPVPDEQDQTNSVNPVNIIGNNVVILQDENGDSLPAEENASIFSSLSGKVFEIGEDGILIEVGENALINAASNSDPVVQNADSVQISTSEGISNNLTSPAEDQNLETVDGGIVLNLEEMPTSTVNSTILNPDAGSNWNNTSLPAEEQNLEIADGGIVLDLGEMPTSAVDATILNPDDAQGNLNNTSLPAEDQNLELFDSGILLDLGESPKICGDSTISNPDAEIIFCKETCPSTENCPSSLALAETEENVAAEVDEPSASKDAQKECSLSVAPSTISEEVDPVDAENESPTGEGNGDYILSATLCAETIVDGPQGESEVFLLIPGQKLAPDEASSAAVVKALSSDMEVYSVTGKKTNSGSSSESSEISPMKKMSIDDPSVTSILQPLIQDLTKKSGIVSEGIKEASKAAIRNPAHLHNVICKFAKFISTNTGGSPLTALKRKGGRSLKGNLQGPTQEATHSDSSSGSESGDDRSESGSDDDHNDYSEDDGEADDNLSGDGGNEDDDDGDDEDEPDDQSDDDDTGDEEDNTDEDDENGQDGAGFLNEDDNNNNDGNESNSEGPEDKADSDSSKEHQNIVDGSDLGVDRASGPKEKALAEDDDARSTHSDDLIIDEGSDKGSSNPLEVGKEASISKNPPQPPAPSEDANPNVRRRSARLKSCEASNAPQEDKLRDLKHCSKICPHCNKKFTKSRNFKEHLWTHQDDRPVFKCHFDSCPKFYYQHRNLKTHIKDYHEGKPFVCKWSGCKMRFGIKRELNVHARRHRFKWLVDVTPTEEDGRLVFKCPLDSCIRSYAQERNLQTHIKIKHEKASTFVCPSQECERQFYSSRDLDHHVKAYGHDQDLSKLKNSKQPSVPVLSRKRNRGSTDKSKSSESESDSSASNIIEPRKKRRCNIGDDSDSSVGNPQKIQGDLSSPPKVKEEPDDPDVKIPLQPLLHIPVKKEEVLVEPKMERGPSVACNKLSSEAWIRVLREASRVMKLSLTAAQD